MFNMGKILKVDIGLTVTALNLKNDDQTWSCVELMLNLVSNVSERNYKKKVGIV